MGNGTSLEVKPRGVRGARRGEWEGCTDSWLRVQPSDHFLLHMAWSCRILPAWQRFGILLMQPPTDTTLAPGAGATELGKLFAQLGNPMSMERLVDLMQVGRGCCVLSPWYCGTV